MFRRLGRIATTIRAQITIIILIAFVTIVTVGGALERWIKADYATPDIENVAQKLDAIAELMRFASTDDRQVILAHARRAGWDISLAPISTAERFAHSSTTESKVSAAAEWLFPPDRTPSFGGWRTFLDDRRLIAAKVDDQTIVMTYGFSDSLLTSSSVGRGSNYFVGIVVLITFFSLFAIMAITEPIRRIAEAARDSNVGNDSPIFEEKGTVEIVTLARALNGMRSRIRLMIDARTRMLRGISHDLRTPLTRLRLRLERLVDGGEKDALLSDVDRIENLLVESLNYLRNDYASEPIELVDVASILQTICNDFADVGYAVSYVGPNKLPARCRPLSITRAVTNLCDNAAKFATTTQVRLSERPDTLVISVEDDGPGIPNDVLERVVEPFFKADVARSTSRGGFGLGLSIVADITRSHGGWLELQQRSPHGLVAMLGIPKGDTASGA